MYSENPFDAEFLNYILILIMMLSNMLKEHTVTKNIPLTHFLLLVFVVQVKQFL